MLPKKIWLRKYATKYIVENQQNDLSIKYLRADTVIDPDKQLVKALESAKGEIHYSTCETMDEQSILPRPMCDCEISEIWEALEQYHKE